MPPAGPGQEAPPDFATHPHFQHLFETLVTGGQTREQASLLLSDLWRNRIHNNVPQQLVQPQPADPQQHQARQGPQPGQADPHDPEQANPAQEPQQPLPPPLPNRDEHPEQPQDLEQGQDQHPLALGPPQAPLDAPPLPSDDLDGPTQHKADKRAVQLPPIDLDAQSRTMSLQRPTAYAIERFTKYEYVPLWYFTQQGCQAADRDKASSEDLWDITKTSDNRLALRTAASNRPSTNALSDEQLSWEQFMDGNHLLCRWLIPAGWPESYAKVLSSFFWQIENHEDIGIPEGKETLLLYQARARKAWHDELKAGHFFNLSKLDERRMNAYRKEVDAKHNAIMRKAVSPPLHYLFPNFQLNYPFSPSHSLLTPSLSLPPTAHSSCLTWMTGTPPGPPPPPVSVHASRAFFAVSCI